MTFTAFLAALAYWGSSMTMTGVGAPTVAAGGSPPTLTGQSLVVSATAATTVAFSGLPATAGSVQVCAVQAHATTATITGPANFTKLGQNQAGTNHAIATFIATSSLVANPSFTITSATYAGACSEWSGALAATADVHSELTTASFNTASAYLGTAVTPTQSNDVLIAFFTIGLNGDNNNSAGGPAGYTEIPGSPATTSPAIRAYYLANPGLSAQQPGRTWAVGNEDCAAGYVAIKHS